MEKTEIKTFIEFMGSMGDNWTEEDVERVYGNKTLSEALIDRHGRVQEFLDYIHNDFGRGLGNGITKDCLSCPLCLRCTIISKLARCRF